jgi:Cu(I)-responsive transcriptional regulator
VSGLRIGALARATGTKVETIRWYEKVGLLGQPERSGANYRVYGGEGLARLSFIRRARDLGFSIDQIRALLDLSDDRSRDCATVDAIASQHLRAVDQKIADLEALRRELARVVSSCAGGTVAECRILDALAPA